VVSVPADRGRLMLVRGESPTQCGWPPVVGLPACVRGCRCGANERGSRPSWQVRAVQGRGRRVPVPAQGCQREIIAVGAYQSKDGAKGGIASVKANAADAPIDDLT
jgi:Domain of unknown function (DUF1508)